MGSRENRLGEVGLTCTHNLCFGSKIRKIAIPLPTPVFIVQTYFPGVMWSSQENSPHQEIKIIIIMIIIIISIFIEDNVFSTTASLPYGPLVNTDIDNLRTFFVIIRTFFILDMRC